MLALSGFKKSYGRTLVLQADQLQIPDGLFWLKGANGAGKSTLLKAIAGIIDFDGDILLDQRLSIRRHPVAYRQLVNFAEAEPLFPGFLTGLEMIALFRDAKGGDKRQEDSFINSMNMEDWIGDQLATYSSGMLKKLSLVLAFMGRPRLILLDEPLITVDAQSLHVLYHWIAEHRSKGVSFVLSSHQPLENFAGELRVLDVRNQELTLATSTSH